MDKELEGRSKEEITAELEENRAAFFPALKETGDYMTGRVYAARAKSRTRQIVERVSSKARQAAITTKTTIRRNVYAISGVTVLAGAAAGFLLRKRFR